jgi:hypothetical protein
MSLERQLADYGRLQEGLFGPISVDEIAAPIVNKRGEGTAMATKTRHAPNPEMRNRFRGPAWALAAFIAVLAVGALYVAFLSDGDQVADSPPTPTTIQAVETSPSPGFSRFNSTIHGISIDYPSGWRIRSATEPWTRGELDFDSPAADVIYDPVLGDSLYIVLASQPRSGATQDYQFDLYAESGVCDPEGGGGFESFTVDGASALYRDCYDPGISGATDIRAVEVTDGNRGYLIVLVRAGDEAGLDEVYDFDAALETVDLRPDEAR